MRRLMVMVVLAAFGGPMAGCGGGEEEGSATPAPAGGAVATPTGTGTAGAETTTAKASPDSMERPDIDGDGSPDVATFEGELGDSFVLVGQPGYKEAAKDAVKATVLKVVGPFKGFELEKGRELIGVRVRFEGVGDEPYDDPQPHAELQLASGEKGKQTSLITVSGKDPCDNKRLELPKGKKVSSCLAFEVPKNDKPKQLTYVAASGYGDTGVWSLE